MAGAKADVLYEVRAPSDLGFHAAPSLCPPPCCTHALSASRCATDWQGSVLEAEPKELFFSTHMDENHADCILRSCAVHYWQRDRKPSLSAWDVVNSSQHEFLAWRAYDNKNVSRRRTRRRC